jgi:biopolymer transport protein ExbB
VYRPEEENAVNVRLHLTILAATATRLALAVLPIGLGLPAIGLAQEQGSTTTQLPPVTGSAELPRDLSPWGMFLSADLVVKAVLIGLVIASVVTWTVWLAKTIELISAKRHGRRALATLASVRSLAEAVQQLGGTNSAAGEFVQASVTELDLCDDDMGREGIKERVASRLERIEANRGRLMMRGTGVLATIGATAPFVGLFGTVWGIMNSFIGISKSHTTNLAVVAPGIAEALLATAFGLAAAIPAVVIYNVFARQIAAYRARLADASAEALRLVSRNLDRTAATSPSSASNLPASCEEKRHQS